MTPTSAFGLGSCCLLHGKLTSQKFSHPVVVGSCVRLITAAVHFVSSSRSSSTTYIHLQHTHTYLHIRPSDLFARDGPIHIHAAEFEARRTTAVSSSLQRLRCCYLTHAFIPDRNRIAPINFKRSTYKTISPPCHHHQNLATRLNSQMSPPTRSQYQP